MLSVLRRLLGKKLQNKTYFACLTAQAFLWTSVLMKPNMILICELSSLDFFLNIVKIQQNYNGIL